MQVLLRQDIKGLGKRGDIVEATDGHARNLLIPKGLAQLAGSGIVSQAASMRKARDARDSKLRESAQAAAQKMAGQTLTLPMRASNEGKLFGSVTSTEIAEAASKQFGIEIDRKAVHLGEHIKVIGQTSVGIILHSEVEFPLIVDVTKA